MAKKKQGKDKPAVETPKPEPAPPTPQQQFQEFVESIKIGFTTINQQFEAMDKRVKDMDAKIARVATTAAKAEDTPQKPTSPMDIIKAVEGILNSPIVNKIAESVMSGGKEEATATPAVDPKYAEMIMAEKVRQEGYQNRWMEAMIQGVELRNTQLKKELESDLF